MHPGTLVVHIGSFNGLFLVHLWFVATHLYQLMNHHQSKFPPLSGEQQDGGVTHWELMEEQEEDEGEKEEEEDEGEEGGDG